MVRVEAKPESAKRELAVRAALSGWLCLTDISVHKTHLFKHVLLLLLCKLTHKEEERLLLRKKKKTSSYFLRSKNKTARARAHTRAMARDQQSVK
jgi:hypothetical protein